VDLRPGPEGKGLKLNTIIELDDKGLSLDERTWITPKEFRECLKGTYLVETYDKYVELYTEKGIDDAALGVSRGMAEWMQEMEREKHSIGEEQ